MSGWLWRHEKTELLILRVVNFCNFWNKFFNAISSREQTPIFVQHTHCLVLKPIKSVKNHLCSPALGSEPALYRLERTTRNKALNPDGLLSYLTTT